MHRAMNGPGGGVDMRAHRIIKFARIDKQQMTKEMEIKGKQSEVKSLKTTSTDLSSDKEGLTGELDAVLAYLDKLKPQCLMQVQN